MTLSVCLPTPLCHVFSSLLEIKSPFVCHLIFFQNAFLSGMFPSHREREWSVVCESWYCHCQIPAVKSTQKRKKKQNRLYTQNLYSMNCSANYMWASILVQYPSLCLCRHRGAELRLLCNIGI